MLSSIAARPDVPRRWPAIQALPLKTSVPGVFAAGDVRAGAMNRVASAVGEGSMVERQALPALR